MRPDATVERVSWHGLSRDEVFARLASGPAGLSDGEARARLARVGRNVLRPTPPTPAWRILLAQLRSTVVLLLVVAAGVAGVTGDVVDAAAIGAVLVINAALGFATELRARRAMEALLALEVTQARVIRGGRQLDIDARELVPGDVIVVESGRAVPADGRLIGSAELRAAEAALTGESMPVSKTADAVLPHDAPLPERSNMVYKATMVAAGQGRAVVIATGMATEVGQIGALVGAIPEARTPLERRLDTLGRRLAGVAVAVAALVAALRLLEGAPLGQVLQTGIALAVAAVPEGLPAVATVAMAIGVRRMARRRALVRHLPTVESLGSVTVICTDKTGTLTSGEMMVTTLWVAEREIRVTGSGFQPEGVFTLDGALVDPRQDVSLAMALRIGALANDADLRRDGDRWVPVGDPTDAALLAAAEKVGFDRTALDRSQAVGEIPFSSSRMLMASFHRATDGALVAYVKGAPRRVVELSARILTTTGDQGLDDAARHHLVATNERFASQGLRVLALACGTVPAPTEDALRDLTFVGFAGMIDPPAPGVSETIRAVREAGVRTVMLTGDQRLTADAVARELGVLGEGDRTLDGGQVDRLDDEQLGTEMERVGAVSRVSPEAKLRIVSAFQRRGEIVAMLGDGVNDAPALKKADVGVAFGRRGTDVAKEAAGIVLQDDRFETVAAAIEEGRVVFDNIRKFVFYLFSCNLAEIAVLLGAAVAGLPLPLLPLQILWLNLVTDTFPALALALEPAEPGVMQRPPRPPHSALLSAGVLKVTVLYAAMMSAATLGAFLIALRRWPDEPHGAITIAFMTLALAQLFHLGNARGETSVLAPSRALANRFALAALALAVGLQLLSVYYTPLARVLGTVPLGVREWVVVLPLALAPAVVGQLSKLAARRRGRGRSAASSAGSDGTGATRGSGS